MVSLVNSNFNSAAVLNLNDAQAQGARATANLAAATKTNQGASDIGLGAVALRTHAARLTNAKLLDNLAGALGYSEAQASSLRKFSDLVSEMSVVVTRMQDSQRSADDLNNDMIQFNGLRFDLVNARREKFADIPLHNRDGQGLDLIVSLDGGYSNTLALTQSKVVEEGAGALSALLGSNEQDLEILSTPVFTSPSGGEGWGTSDTNTPQALVDWGVGMLEKLQVSISRLMTENATQQQRLRDAIDSARTRDIDLEAAEGKITDEDVANEVLSLAKASIRTQAGAAAMAQANSLADSVAQALYGGAGAGIKWHSSILH
jgi:flagellin-like hook-associated protein FlgL